MKNSVDAITSIHPDTRLTTVCLTISDLERSLDFYQQSLGFQVHHHIGFNTWAGVGIPPAPADAIGLRYFTILLPDEAELSKLLDQLHGFKIPIQQRPEGYFVSDPSGNGIILKADNAASS